MKMLSLTTILLTLVIAVGALITRSLAPETFAHLCQEDVLVEPAQAVLYAISAVVFVYASRRSRLGNAWTLGLAALSFWLAGEEVSWGQRMIGVATPDWLAGRNVQKELNLHNLDGLHQHVRIAGVLFVGVLAFAIPLGHRWVSWAKALIDRLELPVFPLFAAPSVAVAMAFMTVPRLRGAIVFELDEISELLLAVGFAAFAVSCAETVRSTAAEGSLQQEDAARSADWSLRP